MYKKLLIYLALFVAFTGLGLSLAWASRSTQNADIVVQSQASTSITSQVIKRTKTSWSWYIIRAAGLVAALSLVILMLSGVGMLTGYTYKFLEPLTAWATHRALGIVFGLSVLVHVIALLFDKFVPFSLLQILVPFTSNYRSTTLLGQNVGSLYVALGVLSFYVMALIVITSLIWIDKKPRLWKLVHLLSYLVMLMIFVHALFIGTDLAHGIFRWLWILMSVSVLYSVFYRLKRARSI